MSNAEIEALRFFKSKKPFKVLQCDKNVGLILNLDADHTALSLEHLSEINKYEQLAEDNTPRIINHINATLLKLLENNHIEKKIFNFLKIKYDNSVKAGSFRLLAKIYKKNFGIRPIINCIGHPTESLCLFIDSILQPIVKNISKILKDSQQMLQELDNKRFKSEPKL